MESRREDDASEIDHNSTGRMCKTLIFVLFSVERIGTWRRSVKAVPTALTNAVFQAVVMGTSPQCYVTFVF